MRTPNTIFVHGILQRSGTNYLNNLLLLHPNTFCNSTSVRENYYLRFCDHLNRYGADLFRLWSNPDWKGAPFSEDDFFRTIGTALVDYLREGEAPLQRLITKTPSVRNIDFFKQFFGEAKLVFIVRDPRDIAQSAYKTWNRPLPQTAAQWNQGSLDILNYQKKHGPESSILVRYEDIVQNTEHCLRELLKQLDLDVNQYPWEQISDVGVTGSSERGWQTVKASPDFNPIGRWKSWDAKTLLRFESDIQDTMKCFGYPLSGSGTLIEPLPNEMQRQNWLASLNPRHLKTSYTPSLPRRAWRLLKSLKNRWAGR